VVQPPGAPKNDSLEMRFLAEPAGVAPARHAVTDLARRVGMADEIIANVALAVSEAITNAVLHGYVDREAGFIEVAAQAEGAELVVTVTDDGGGMVPRPDSPGLGMGLPIIARLTRALDVRSPESGIGTQLCMTFGPLN
jgi:serine/threonine-protein kinase RsbW/stage II sporulation protein AB (anti-sigma F factor)